ncbi:MAG: sialate O-acetylesterase [Bacteroidales bacterium]|nr:sialate O-acetylesterase [Bacteroidales bacterium]
MKKTFLLIMALFAMNLANAAIKLPKVIGDNMVLQRNSNVNLWGEASPNKTVKIKTSWNGKQYSVKSDNDGNWKVAVVTSSEGGPYTIEITDGEKLELKNILLGEVWICSGQSNMEMPVKGFVNQPVENAAKYITEASQYPQIRMFTVERNSIDEAPQKDCKGGEWLTSTPKSVADFSATGYFFGYTLNKMLNIPIGLITTNWGGSTIETWMTKESISSIPGVNMEVISNYKNDNARAQALYNGMINPIKNFTAKGFIWYQGESNRGNYYDYASLMKKMIELWRTEWNDQEMPFYMVQLAPYNYEGAQYRSLPLVIEAQYKAASELKHCDVAATTDIGHPQCIHPSRKLQVGQRLAYLALANDYGIEGLPANSPTYKSLEIKDNKVVLSFNNVNNDNSFCGFSTTGVNSFEGFEIAGEDQVFYPAQANLVWWQNKMEVKSDNVAKPVAVRYGFANFSTANVTTALGLPLVPFRTDNWDIPQNQIFK